MKPAPTKGVLFPELFLLDGLLTDRRGRTVIVIGVARIHDSGRNPASHDDSTDNYRGGAHAKGTGDASNCSRDPSATRTRGTSTNLDRSLLKRLSLSLCDTGIRVNMIIASRSRRAGTDRAYCQQLLIVNVITAAIREVDDCATAVEDHEPVAVEQRHALLTMHILSSLAHDRCPVDSGKCSDLVRGSYRSAGTENAGTRQY